MDLEARSFLGARGSALNSPRVRPRRESLPITALRLTPISAAISRQERPASKWPLRRSTRSVVQVGPNANMFTVPHSVDRCALEFPSGRLAVVADRKQPVLDGEPNAFLDQGLCDAGNAGTVGALSHQFYEVADGRECQRDWNAVGFGFFCSHGER